MATASDSDRTMGRSSPFVNPEGRISPTPGAVLMKAHIADALASSRDDGCTLDFSNKNLIDVSENGAEELSQIGRGEDLVDECCILRIALVGNRLTSLPTNFARLSRLRYITLRSNSFSTFPEVLTDMPSLEILDFGRNKLRQLPANPGTLVNLRVLSISRNKIRRLPSYICKFRYLTVLKADHNIIEWPPKDVMEPEVDLEDSEVMHQWVDSLKEWLAGNQSGDEEESVLGKQIQFDAGVTPHARSFSVESENSIYTVSSYSNSVEESEPERPPTIDTSVSPSMPSALSASPESYLPTPDGSLTSGDDDTARPLRSPLHGRNKSYAIERMTGAPSLSMQKSLPDLRTARAHYMSHERAPAPMPKANEQSSSESFSSQTEASSAISDTPPLRSRQPRLQQARTPTTSASDRRVPSMDYERNSYFRRLSMLPTSTINRTTPPPLLSVVDSVRGILFAVSQIYQSLEHYTVYAIDERLSSVLLKVLDPASNCMMELISALDKFDASSKKGCPPPSICRRVIEGCRDNVAMFGKAVSVLALQLKVLASHDDVRYSRHMLLVLYGAMAEVSNAWQAIAPRLESLDPLLREERPTPVFRTATASSSSSGSTVIHTTKPLKTRLASQTSANRILIPPIAEQPEPSTASAPAAPLPALPRPPPLLSRTHSAQPSLSSTPRAAPPMARPSASEGRSRMARRHAGSFSVKDVEIGRSLPSTNANNSTSGGVASSSSTPTPRPRTMLARNPSPLPPEPVPPLPASTTAIFPPFPLPASHSRQGSSQNGSGASTPVPPAGPSRSNTDIPTNSNAQVDKEAIDAMASAVRAAPSVWAMLEEISGDLPEVPGNLRDSLMKAQDVTRRLGENIKAIQESLSSADRKALREDAHVFVKTVIALSKVVKDYGSAHRLSSQLRSDIAKLTNATQEFVMLLHVSSFSLSSSSRPFSPMQLPLPVINSAAVAGQGATSLQPQPSLSSLIAEEKQQMSGAGLSRSRSAQPSASFKLASVAANVVPRSALPHQTFKIPVVTSRLNASSRLRNGDLDYGNEGHG